MTPEIDNNDAREAAPARDDLTCEHVLADFVLETRKNEESEHVFGVFVLETTAGRGWIIIRGSRSS